jgi:hypothetical protein
MAQDQDLLDPFRAQLKPAALVTAGQVLGWAKQNGLLPKDTGFLAGGGAWIEWRQGCKDVRVVIHSDGLVEYLLHGQADSAFEAARELLWAAFGPSSRL